MNSSRIAAIAVVVLAASFGCGSATLHPDGGTAGNGGGGVGGSGKGGKGGAGASGGSVGGIGGGVGGAAAGTGGSTGGSAAGAGRGGTGGSAGARGGAGGGPCADECCADTDCGSCQICTAAHACSTVRNQDDPSGHCAGTCDGSGACKSKKGQSCTATSGGCISGAICAPDGYCCNASCGTDATCKGTCAGRADGSCTYPTAPCGTATCSGTDLVARGTCGNGMCQMPAPAPCTGGFVCSAGACKTSCAGQVDCVSTSYCSGTSCVAKKAPGAVCGNASECTTGVCGGRCCNTGVPCNCPQPSPSNAIQNPGFDMDKQLTGWTVGSGTATVSWDANDPNSCPYSGSAKISNLTAAGDSQMVSQCVPVSRQTTYNFGVTMQASGGYTHCGVDIFPSANCQGAGINQFDDVWLNVSWSDDMATTIATGNMVSARVYCWTESSVALNFDMVYLTPAPGKF